MIHRLMCFLALIFSLEVLGQNLIPNPSFEDTICSIPGLPSPWDDPFYSPSRDWFNPNNATPDHYTTAPSEFFDCGHFSIYDSDWDQVGEWQYPKEGDRMLGLWLGNDLNVSRDLLEAKLLEPLMADTDYCFSMYVSLGNRQNLAIDRIGAFFSMDSVYDHSWAGGFEYEESMYVTSPAGIFLTDTVEWMLIEGVYTAQGGEEFILIGNAFDDTETSYLEVDGWGNGWDVAKYFIDDLSLVSCTSLSTGDDKLPIVEIEAHADQGIRINGRAGLRWTLWDSIGRVLIEGQMSQEQELIPTDWISAGIYLLTWEVEGHMGSEKLYLSR